MTAEQKQDYKTYRNECLASGTEPTPADFLGVELSDEEVDAGKFRSWVYLRRKLAVADALMFEFELRTAQLAKAAHA